MLLLGVVGPGPEAKVVWQGDRGRLVGVDEVGLGSAEGDFVDLGRKEPRHGLAGHGPPEHVQAAPGCVGRGLGGLPGGEVDLGVRPDHVRPVHQRRVPEQSQVQQSRHERVPPRLVVGLLLPVVFFAVLIVVFCLFFDEESFFFFFLEEPPSLLTWLRDDGEAVAGVLGAARVEENGVLALEVLFEKRRWVRKEIVEIRQRGLDARRQGARREDFGVVDERKERVQFPFELDVIFGERRLEVAEEKEQVVEAVVADDGNPTTSAGVRHGGEESPCATSFLLLQARLLPQSGELRLRNLRDADFETVAPLRPQRSSKLDAHRFVNVPRGRLARTALRLQVSLGVRRRKGLADARQLPRGERRVFVASQGNRFLDRVFFSEPVRERHAFREPRRPVHAVLVQKRNRSRAQQHVVAAFARKDEDVDGDGAHAVVAADPRGHAELHDAESGGHAPHLLVPLRRRVFPAVDFRPAEVYPSHLQIKRHELHRARQRPLEELHRLLEVIPRHVHLLPGAAGSAGAGAGSSSSSSWSCDDAVGWTDGWFFFHSGEFLKIRIPSTMAREEKRRTSRTPKMATRERHYAKEQGCSVRCDRSAAAMTIPRRRTAAGLVVFLLRERTTKVRGKKTGEGDEERRSRCGVHGGRDGARQLGEVALAR
mmetsp:Transcript_16974/g.51520  ORF Transcript_16974/g.51520 Transcript_16974/m.51520 type:complete len:653 (+) Transcript_16974:285-2243(+)